MHGVSKNLLRWGSVYYTCVFMKFSLAFLLTSILTFYAGTAHARTACYTQKESTAEKVLRLHTELMVITVTCKQSSRGRDLGRAYSRLTQRHIKPIQVAESILKNFYSGRHGGDGMAHLDRIRTKLANDYGQIAAREGATPFCNRRRDRVIRLHDSRYMNFEQESLRSNRYIGLLSPVCASQAYSHQNRRKQPVWE